MPDTLVFTRNGPKNSGPESRKSPRQSEIWKVTSASAAAGDASVLTTDRIKIVEAVVGQVLVTSGLGTNAVTLKTPYAISSSEAVFVEVIGY